MLSDREMPLSSFCLTSLRKTLGTNKLQELCAEVGVAWQEAEIVLAEDRRTRGSSGRRDG